MIYFTIILLLWIAAVLTTVKNEQVKSGWALEILILISIYIIVIGGFRFEVGADWGSYLEIFDTSNISTSSSIEPGYLLMNKLFKVIGIPHVIFVFFLFLLSYTIKVITFYKYSTNVFIALLVYIPIQFIVYDINAVRQGLAVGILLLSLPYVLKRQILPYIFICLLAASIHISALVFVPFYWFALKKVADRRIILYLIILILVALISKAILDLILPTLGANFSLFEKFVYYSVNEEYNKHLSFNLSTIYRVLILVLFISRHQKMNISEQLYLMIRNGYFLSLVIYFTFFSVELVATRGSLYYRVFDILIFGFVINSFKDIYLRQLSLLALVFYVGIQIFVSLQIENSGLLPYNNAIFQW